MATVTVEHYGIEGTGKNVTEAKRDAGAKIQAALSGSYCPTIVAWRGNAVLVWREPDGWHNRLIVASDDIGIREGRLHGVSYGRDEKEAIRSAQMHVAQLGWTHDDTDDAPSFVTDRNDRHEFTEWVTFQRRYRRARNAGLNDHEAHAYACGSLGRPDLEERVPA